MEAFHQRLRRLREAKGLSSKEVARRIGKPETTYREWEYGRAIQGEKPYVALSKVYGISVYELLGGSQVMSCPGSPRTKWAGV